MSMNEDKNYVLQAVYNKVVTVTSCPHPHEHGRCQQMVKYSLNKDTKIITECLFTSHVADNNCIHYHQIKKYKNITCDITN